MPTFTVAAADLQRVGPVVEVQIAVNEAVETTLRDAGGTVPPPILIPGIIDTGAGCTVILSF